MRDFCAWVGMGFMKWLLVVAAFGCLLPVLAFGCDVNTELLVGGYLPEGKYICYTYDGTQSEFVIAKNADTRRGSSKHGHYYTTKFDDVTYSIYYAEGSLHFRSGIAGVVAANPRRDIVHKDGDVYYVTHSENRGPYLWFALADDPDAVARTAELSGYSNSITCS